MADPGGPSRNGAEQGGGRGRGRRRLGTLASLEASATTRLGKLQVSGGIQPDVTPPLKDPKAEPVAEGGSGPARGGVRKFAPKVPARRVKKQAVDQPQEDDTELVDPELPAELRALLKEGGDAGLDLGRKGRPKTEGRGAPAAKVAFGFGQASTFQGSKSGSGARGTFAGSSVERKSQAKGAKYTEGSVPGKEEGKRDKKSNEDHFDSSKYHPMTLPIRPPKSVALDPLMTPLPDEEYKDDQGTVMEKEEQVKEMQEDYFTPAEELHLEGGDMPEDRLLFFQLPDELPLNDKQAKASKEGEGKVNLRKLQEGVVGKLLIYESGAVKLRLGEVLLDALPGARCQFHQELVAISPESQEAHFLGDVRQRVILTPDIDHLLS